MTDRDFGNLVREHVDRYLGPEPSRVFVDETLGIHVAFFVDKPDTGLLTSITIGLSGHALEQPASGRKIRQELMVCVDRRYRELAWREILLSAAKQILDRHTAVMLGEVMGPAGRLFPEAPWCNATALLVSLPTFFDADFAEVEFDEIPMVFAELIPITTSEAEWIHQFGWSAFFDRINSGEVNILDLDRA